LPNNTPEDIIQILLDIRAASDNEIEELERDKNERLLEHMVTMRQGKGFGELALKREKLDRRAATIQCLTDCHLAAISKESYQRVVQKIDQRKMRKLIDFFKNIPFLSKNSQTYLIKLHYNFEQRNFIRNQVLYAEGDVVNYIYLIKEGEFEVTRKIRMDMNRADHDKKKEFLKYLSVGQPSTKELPNPRGKPSSSGKNNRAQMHSSKKYVKKP
jgi:hypothetical protein